MSTVHGVGDGDGDAGSGLALLRAKVQLQPHFAPVIVKASHQSEIRLLLTLTMLSTETVAVRTFSMVFMVISLTTVIMTTVSNCSLMKSVACWGQADVQSYVQNVAQVNEGHAQHDPGALW